jgi:hypothetical protein
MHSCYPPCRWSQGQVLLPQLLPVAAHLIPFITACCCFLHWPVHTSLPPYEQLLIAAMAGSTLCPIQSPSVNTLIQEAVAQSLLLLLSFSIMLIVVLGCARVLSEMVVSDRCRRKVGICIPGCQQCSPMGGLPHCSPLLPIHLVPVNMSYNCFQRPCA